MNWSQKIFAIIISIPASFLGQGESIIQHSSIQLKVMDAPIKNQNTTNEFTVKNHDTAAIFLLDRMSELIGDLKTAGYTLRTSYDSDELGLGMIKYFDVSKVELAGPNKFHTDTRGSKGHKGYWCDGENLTYYSYSENNFGQIPAQENLMETVDYGHSKYGIDFPGADFFYPSFTDDLISEFQSIKYLGTTIIDGDECFHILAKNDKLSFQLWLSNDGKVLPIKFVVNYLNASGSNGQYEGTFTDWSLNPNYADAYFDFNIPPNAKRIRMISKNE